jgi:hypothetical protein
MLFAEGEGEGDQGAGGSTGVVDEGSAEGQQASNGDDGRQQNSQHVPYERFSEVTRKNKELAAKLASYEKLGGVDQVAKDLARAKELATGRRFTEAELKALKDDLLQVDVIKEASDFMKEQKEKETRLTSTFRTTAMGKVSTFIKGLGVEFKTVSEREALELDAQAQMAERIRRTPGWLDRWNSRDMTVVEDAWKAVKQYYGGLRRTQNAAIQANKLQTNKVGSDGKAPSGGQKDNNGYPLTADGKIDERAVLARASERGFGRLKASEE